MNLAGGRPLKLQANLALHCNPACLEIYPCIQPKCEYPNPAPSDYEIIHWAKYVLPQYRNEKLTYIKNLQLIRSVTMQKTHTDDINSEPDHFVPLHVHDLPQLYTRPSFEILIGALELLRIQPTTFSKSDSAVLPAKVDPEGVPRYLTSIISSSLGWLKDDAEKERIWETASARLSERSGRSAMPSMTRSFYINDDLTIDLFEPSLTEDNLGLKTWTSSLMLARRLSSLRHHLPQRCGRVLELGSGTGLVGIAAAALWGVNVTLTDLPEIVPNLEKNITSNMRLFQESGVKMQARPLDWSLASDSPSHRDERFSLIVAADPIYSSDHPRMLVNAVSRWISREPDARFIVELPLRRGYEKERKDLRDRLAEAKMQVVEEGTEIGYDDWQGADGRPAEVECWWSVWKHIIESPPLQ